MKRICRFSTIAVLTFVILTGYGCQQKISSEHKKADAPARPAPVVEKGPRIEFEKTFHDYGDVSPDTWNVCEFKFTNTGTDVLKIAKIRSTCGCTVPKLSKTDYQPGESGVIKVKYHAERAPGKKTRHLNVPSNDKKKPKVVLTIEANVVYKVAYEPKILNLVFNKDNAGCPEIKLKSLDGRPFAIKQITSSRQCVTADYDSSVEALEFVLKPKVNMDRLKRQMSGRINIMLTHPDCRMVSVQYKAKPAFKLSPPSIVIFDADPNKPITKDVLLVANYKQSFKISSVSAKKGFIKVLDKQKLSDRCRLTIQITAPKTVDKRTLFTDTLTVVTDSGERVELPCRGFYSKHKEAGGSGSK